MPPPLLSDAPTAGPPRHTLSMTVLMTPDLANFSGDVHGGHILRLLDQVAYTLGTRWSEKQVVTLSVDRVVFREPIHVGELVTFDASVNFTGTTSMEVGIRVTTEDIKRRSVRHTNSCYLTMVVLDDDHRPTPVRKLTPRTETEWKRWQQAMARRDLRKRTDPLPVLGQQTPAGAEKA